MHVRRALIITALFLVSVVWCVGIMGGCVWIFEDQRYIPHLFAFLVLPALPITIMIWKDCCEKDGGLSFSEIIGVPLFSYILTPFLFFAPMLYTFSLMDEWYPHKPCEKKVILKCGVKR